MNFLAYEQEKRQKGMKIEQFLFIARRIRSFSFNMSSPKLGSSSCTTDDESIFAFAFGLLQINKITADFSLF